MRKDPQPAKEILAKNLIRLMDREGAKKISTYQVAGHRKGEKATGPLSARTVGRIRRAEGNATLDHIDAIAKFFLLEPWQLLVPNFRTEDPPHLSFTDEEKKALESVEEGLAILAAFRQRKT